MFEGVVGRQRKERRSLLRRESSFNLHISHDDYCYQLYVWTGFRAGVLNLWVATLLGVEFSQELSKTIGKHRFCTAIHNSSKSYSYKVVTKIILQFPNMRKCLKALQP